VELKEVRIYIKIVLSSIRQGDYLILRKGGVKYPKYAGVKTDEKETRKERSRMKWGMKLRARDRKVKRRFGRGENGVRFSRWGKENAGDW